MVIIDFSATQKKAFSHGFAKGMAAPVQLYGSFKAPSLPDIKKIEVSSITSEQALNGDWYKIGADFTNVISKYVSETYPKK